MGRKNHQEFYAEIEQVVTIQVNPFAPQMC
jgi:hypothetical protein